MTRRDNPKADIIDVVGVVVIGRNEGQRLISCIESVNLLGLCFVYVDSGSTDGSPAAARARGGAVVELDMTRPFTAARARNEGFARLLALHPDVAFVQFVDGDCVLSEGWIDRAVAALRRDPGVAVVCGRRRERFPHASIYNRLCDLEWNTPVGPTNACGGDALFVADAFQSVGGFNFELIAGEEPELCHRLRAAGWTIERIDAEMTIHDAAISRFTQWWRRAVRSGFGYAQVYQTTKDHEPRLYRSNIARALFWGALVPIGILAAAIAVHPSAALVGIAVYMLQIARIAVRRGATNGFNWSYAALMTAAKFGEARGVLSYALRRPRTAPTIIEYK